MTLYVGGSLELDVELAGGAIRIKISGRTTLSIGELRLANGRVTGRIDVLWPYPRKRIEIDAKGSLFHEDIQIKRLPYVPRLERFRSGEKFHSLKYFTEQQRERLRFAQTVNGIQHLGPKDRDLLIQLVNGLDFVPTYLDVKLSQRGLGFLAPKRTTKHDVPIGAHMDHGPRSKPVKLPGTDAGTTEETRFHVVEVTGRARAAPIGTPLCDAKGWKRIEKGQQLGRGLHVSVGFRGRLELVAWPAESNPKLLVVGSANLCSVNQLAEAVGIDIDSIGYGHVRTPTSPVGSRNDMELECPVVTISRCEMTFARRDGDFGIPPPVLEGKSK